VTPRGELKRNRMTKVLRVGFDSLVLSSGISRSPVPVLSFNITGSLSISQVSSEKRLECFSE
jgi:hypothetical protein